jgi:hypothetical protein
MAQVQKWVQADAIKKGDSSGREADVDGGQVRR